MMDFPIPELQQRLLDANLGLVAEDFAYHASDLYVVSKPGVREWLNENLEHPKNATGFRSQEGSNWNGAGKSCIDIPFMGYWPDMGRDPRVKQFREWQKENPSEALTISEMDDDTDFEVG